METFRFGIVFFLFSIMIFVLQIITVTDTLFVKKSPDAGLPPDMDSQQNPNSTVGAIDIGS
ncbi:MAG: hypothetical protein GY866_16910 [Proteobacteria bacterium]|nr:hypothetical protein [Pseudomonadota bacterium]